MEKLTAASFWLSKYFVEFKKKIWFFRCHRLFLIINTVVALIAEIEITATA